jgi:adenylylsulfate kinase-like enzyme
MVGTGVCSSVGLVTGQDLGFSASDRGESVRRVGELSCLMNDAGTITIVSLVGEKRNTPTSCMSPLIGFRIVLP